MKRTNKKIIFMMILLMACSMVLAMVPTSVQTAKADAPVAMAHLSTSTSSVPADGPIVAVSANNSSAFFIAADGTVYGYGTTTNGETGDGGASGQVRPMFGPVLKADLSNLTGIERIWGCHNYAVYGYDYDTETLYGWGLNTGFRINPSIQWNAKWQKATVINLPEGFSLSRAENAVAIGASSMAVLGLDGQVWSWGQMHDTTAGKEDMNLLGYDFVADGTVADHVGETEVVSTITYMKVPHPVPLPLNVGETVVSLQMGWYGVYYAFTSESRVIAWGGMNTAGQNVHAVYGSYFVEIEKPAGKGAEFSYEKIAVAKGGSVVALGNDGKVYTLNAYAFVGNLDTGNHPIFPLARSKQFQAEMMVLDLDDNGLDDGNTFIDVGSGGDASDGYNKFSGMAVRDDGRVFVWGYENDTSRLGDGQFAALSVRDPAVDVSTLPGFPIDGEDMAGGRIGSSLNHCLMLKDSVMYGWGQNVLDATNYIGKFYPMTLVNEGKEFQSAWPRRVDYNKFPEAFRYNGTSYPAETPVADAEYVLSVEAIPDVVMKVSGLSAGMEGKNVAFYDENGTAYGTATVSAGQASIVLTGLTEGVEYTAYVKSLDAHDLLWAPILNGISFKPEELSSGDPPVVTGVVAGGTYNTPRTITFDKGTATLNGSAFNLGDTVSALGNYTLVVTEGELSTTVNFDIVPIDMVWTLKDNIYMTGIAPGVLGGALKAGFTVQIDISSIVIKKTDNTVLLDTQRVGTGMTVELLDEASAVFRAYQVLMYGDLTGEGTINALDLLALKKQVLGLISLEGVFFHAGNITKDLSNTVNAIDLLALKKHILGLLLIVQ